MMDHFRVPLLLDVAEMPPHDCDGPCRGERPHDDKTRGIDIEIGEKVEERVVETELLSHQANQLDRPDEKGHEHRQTRDRQVVEDLANGL